MVSAHVPAAPPAEPSSELARFERAAVEHVAGLRPANTARAYGDDFACWTRYCREFGVDPGMCTSGLLVGFVAWLNAHGAAPATMDRRLTGVVTTLRAQGIEVPSLVARAARAAIAGYARQHATCRETRGRGQAPALLVDQLRTIVTAQPDTLAGVRDRALVLLGFALATRRSELANLHVDDFVEHDQGLLVTIPVSKTGPAELAVTFGEATETCPVAAWQHWRIRADLASGPAFRSVSRWGRIGAGLTPDSVGRALRRAAERAGLDLPVTGHSLRAGLATQARDAGHDLTAIAQHGRWAPTSRSLHRYLRTVDQWAETPTRGLGL